MHYLGRLLENGKRQRAWALFKTCHAREPRFRPVDDEALLTLVGMAAPEDGPLVEALLADFPDAYPDSHLIANARFRLARLMHENWQRDEEAIAVLRAQVEPVVRNALPADVDVLYTGAADKLEQALVNMSGSFVLAMAAVVVADHLEGVGVLVSASGLELRQYGLQSTVGGRPR